MQKQERCGTGPVNPIGRRTKKDDLIYFNLFNLFNVLLVFVVVFFFISGKFKIES